MSVTVNTRDTLLSASATRVVTNTIGLTSTTGRFIKQKNAAGTLPASMTLTATTTGYATSAVLSWSYALNTSPSTWLAISSAPISSGTTLAVTNTAIDGYIGSSTANTVYFRCIVTQATKPTMTAQYFVDYYIEPQDGTIGTSSTVYYISASAPVSYKDAADITTDGVHTNTTFTALKVVGNTAAVAATDTYYTLTYGDVAEAGTATLYSAPVTTSISNSADINKVTFRMYNNAAKTTLLDTEVANVVFKGASGAAATVYYISISAPVIYKDAPDITTDGVHTSTTFTSLKVVGSTIAAAATDTYYTLTYGNAVEAGTATLYAAPVITSIANTADIDKVTFKMYSSAAKTTLLDTEVAHVVFKGAPGGPGAEGSKSVTVMAYKWSTTVISVVPSQAFTYNWTTGAPSANPSTWSSSAPASPGTGNTLYVLALPITTNATNTGTSSHNWSSSSINVFGYTEQGTIGLSGIGQRTAYTVTTSGTAPTGITANGALPPSAPGTWSFTATSTLAAGEYMYQVDGTLNSAGTLITWGNAYLSNLKVGSLSALTANLGLVDVAVDGGIKSGKTGYTDTAAGFYLGRDATSHKFNIGNDTDYMKWTGSGIEVKGAISATSGYLQGLEVRNSDGTVLINAGDTASNIRNSHAIETAAADATLKADAARGKSLCPPLEQWITSQSFVTISDGKVGTSALRITGAGSTTRPSTYFPIDSSKTYRTRFWARPSATNTSGLLFFCLQQFTNNTGTTGPDNGGRAPYKPSGQSPSTHNSLFGAQQWGEYSYTWNATDWQAGVTFVRPDFLENYPGAVGHWDVQDFVFEEVTEVVSAATTAVWTGVTGTGRPSDNASSNIVLVNEQNMAIAGNKATKVAGGALAWDASVRSKNGYAGGAYASAVADQTNGNIMFGLNASSDLTNSSYETIDYAVYLKADGSWNIYESGTDRGNFGVYAVGDVFDVVYDGSNVRYLRNGVVFRGPIAANITVPLFFDSSFYTYSSISGIALGPMSSNAWGAIGYRPTDAELLNSYAPIGQNLIPNSDQTSANTFGISWYGAVGSLNNVYADGVWSATYVIKGGTTRNLVSHQNAPYAGDNSTLAADIYPLGGWIQANSIPVVAGQRYMFSAYLQSHRCNYAVGIYFFNTSDGVLDPTLLSSAASGPGGSADSLSAYSRQFIAGVAPSGAAYARVYIRKYNTWAGSGDSYIWYAAPQFETVTTNAAGPSPYTSGPVGSTRQLGYIGPMDATKGAQAGVNLTDSAGVSLTDLSIRNNRDGSILVPGGGLLITGTPVVGAIKIRLPQGYTSTMVRFTVDIYEYAAGYSCSLDISGYTYSGSSTWINVSASVIGGNTEYPVYFGHDQNGYCSVWIGTLDTSWEYPQIRVSNVLVGYENYARVQWEAGWEVTIVNSWWSHNNQVLDTYPGANWAKVSGNDKPLGATAAANALATKLATTGAQIMDSTLSLQTAGFSGGNGVALYNGGILGRKGGTAPANTTFSIDTNGNAYFGGELRVGIASANEAADDLKTSATITDNISSITVTGGNIINNFAATGSRISVWAMVTLWVEVNNTLVDSISANSYLMLNGMPESVQNGRHRVVAHTTSSNRKGVWYTFPLLKSTVLAAGLKTYSVNTVVSAYNAAGAVVTMGTGLGMFAHQSVTLTVMENKV